MNAPLRAGSSFPARDGSAPEGGSSGRPLVAIVVKGYPRLSETFIAQEMLALQRRGLPFEIWALRLPTDKAVHPLNRAITAKARYLPEYLYQQPMRVLRGAWAALRMPGLRRLMRTFCWAEPSMMSLPAPPSTVT
jgi:hypothetical protein